MNLLPLRETVHKRMRDDDTLDALLARDPNDATQPAIIRGNLNTQPPVYPCITYRLPDIKSDIRFQPTLVEGGGESPVQTVLLEMEAWAKDSDRTDAITGRLCTLWTGVRVPFANGVIFQVDQLTVNLDLPDTDDNATFSLMRFLLHLRLTSF